MARRLRLGAEEFLTEMATDQAIADVNAVVEKDQNAEQALDNIEQTEDEAQDVREELDEGDTSDTDADTTGGGDDEGTGDSTSAGGDPDADTSGTTGDGAQDTDAASAGAQTNEVKEEKKQDADKEGKLAAESIFARWR